MKFLRGIGYVFLGIFSFIVIAFIIILICFLVSTTRQTDHKQAKQTYNSVHVQHKTKNMPSITIKHTPKIKRFYKYNDFLLATDLNIRKNKIRRIQKATKSEAFNYKNRIKNKSKYQIIILPVKTHVLKNYKADGDGNQWNNNTDSQDVLCDTDVLIMRK